MIVLRQSFPLRISLLLHRYNNYKPNHISYQCLSTTTNNNNNNNNNNNQPKNGLIRIAIVGAGASGMSTALHLAPLAEKGLIAKPIDIYEKSNPSIPHPHEQHSDMSNEDFHPGSGHVGRDVGIGIWSTALMPFLGDGSSQRATHLDLIRNLQEKGKYVGRVGYRTPSGKWLTKSKLSTKELNSLGDVKAVSADASNDANDANGDGMDPSLLFIREKDFLTSLRSACEVEEQKFGTIRIHSNTQVYDVAMPRIIDEANTGYLKLSHVSSNDDDDDKDESNTANHTHLSSKPYHIVITADGTHSSFRKKYAGYSRKWEQKTGVTEKLSEEWEKQVLEDLNAIEDRKYTVFRGNAPLNNKEAHMDATSFQTWGKGKSMRFAAVGMEEEQVWFATICDEETKGTKSVEERKKLLVESFQDWHDPVGSLIESTPAKDIFMERAVCHKHSVYPVFNLSEIIDYQDQCRRRKEANNSGSAIYDTTSSSDSSSIGPGPIVLFTGDAAMAIDPVLAQGFTIAMESAADFAQTLESCLENNNASHPPLTPSDMMRKQRAEIKEALVDRNQRRYERLLCLLRATTLVQEISQPSSAISSLVSNNIVRPAMMITPSFLKEAVFSYMIKYSLGLKGSQSLYNKSSCDITKAQRVNTVPRR